MEKWDRLERLIGEDKIQMLKNKTVLVVGLGGVGGYVIEGLVRSGIGHFILVDFDCIDITNLNRQIIALHSTIGKNKTEVIEKRILDINPECEVSSYNLFLEKDNILDVFNKKIDFAIDACDTVKTKKSFIRVCIDKKIPFISCMGTGNKFCPELLKITDIRNTSYDPLAKIIRKWVKDEGIKDKVLVLSSNEEPISSKDGIIGSTSFVPSIAGLYIASYVMRFFCKIEIKKSKN